MTKNTAIALFVAVSLQAAAEQPPGADKAQLQLAADTLSAMGQTPDPKPYEDAWRKGVAAGQVRAHNTMFAQYIDTLFQSIRPLIDAQVQTLYQIRQKSLATTFSRQELERIRDFYLSGIGRKLVDQERAVEPRLLEANQAYARQLTAQTMTMGMAMGGGGATSAPGVRPPDKSP